MIEEELVPFGFIEDANDPEEYAVPGDQSTWIPAGEKNQFEYF